MFFFYRDYSNVQNHPETNNLAYTNKKLNLHNDMPQYNEIPGVKNIACTFISFRFQSYLGLASMNLEVI